MSTINSRKFFIGLAAKDIKFLPTKTAKEINTHLINDHFSVGNESLFDPGDVRIPRYEIEMAYHMGFSLQSAANHVQKRLISGKPILGSNAQDIRPLLWKSLLYMEQLGTARLNKAAVYKSYPAALKITTVDIRRDSGDASFSEAFTKSRDHLTDEARAQIVLLFKKPIKH